MDQKKIIKKYIPMTETAFYILLALNKPRHGYGIVKHVEDITAGRLRLGSGTVYGTLTKMQKDGVIVVFSDEHRKTLYEITDAGKELINEEIKRVNELYRNAANFEEDFKQ